MDDRKRKPLLRGRSFLLIDDFCLNTGLDRETAENLLRTELLDVSLWTEKEPIRPMAIFSDALPSREELAAMGLPVSDDYDPRALRYGKLTDDPPLGS